MKKPNSKTMTVSMGILLILLGTIAFTFAKPAQHKQDAKSPKQEQQAKPEKQQRQQQQEAKGQQVQHQADRPSQQGQHVQQGELPSVWQQHRAHSWQAEHRTWQQRGGYKGYRIPKDHFRGNFGPHHAFRM